MRPKDNELTYFDGAKVRSALEKMNVSLEKVSTLVLGKEGSYISKTTNKGRIQIEDLKKLCEFCSIRYEDVIVAPPDPTVTTQVVENKSDSLTVAPLETVIVGLNTMYENQNKMCAVLDQLLVELKALNVKQNRLENALGQAVTNMLIVKENTNKIVDAQNHLKSQSNIISGRARDLVQIFQKGGKA